MHSSLVRLQNVFGFFTTVAFSVAGIIALSVLLHPQSPSAELSMSNVSVIKGRPNYYSTKKEEYAHIKFDLSADLTSLFSWNTKQLFVYIVAVFPSTKRGAPSSEAIVWDAIIPSPLAPWHANTYIHPGTTKSPRQSRDRARSRANTPAAKRSKKLNAHDKTLDEFAPHPPGAEPGIVRLEGQKPKYQISTPTGRIAGLDNCTLYLRYNVQPWVGLLTWDAWPSAAGQAGSIERCYTPFWKRIVGGRSQVFEMPAIKGEGASSVKKEDLGTETGGEANRGSPA